MSVKKLVSLKEAISLIEDGDIVFLEGSSMAVVQ